MKENNFPKRFHSPIDRTVTVSFMIPDIRRKYKENLKYGHLGMFWEKQDAFKKGNL